ncbi:hypothetical protein [Deferribacter abyssi]|uniref:hypothetical protein n=1 Tax=Deferribacter abyssi TaxID=213806 RepID=UPI003C24F367
MTRNESFLRASAKQSLVYHKLTHLKRFLLCNTLEKRYYEKYVGKVKDIYLIGIEFSRSERNIVGFDVLTLNR